MAFLTVFSENFVKYSSVLHRGTFPMTLVEKLFNTISFLHIPSVYLHITDSEFSYSESI